MFNPFSAMNSRKSQHNGIVKSIEGKIYFAMEVSDSGEEICRANRSFKSLSDAKAWLNRKGVDKVTLEQSSAYFEMDGQSDNN